MTETSAPITPAPNPRRGHSLRRKLLIIGLAGVVLLLVGEWALKRFNIERLSFTNPLLYEVDEELGYRMRSNVRVYSHGAWYETNAAGLRGPHWDEVHGQGKHCVLFIGHSIGGGFGVTAEEAFPGLFSELNSLDLVGINLGISSYRYWQEFALAMRFVDEIQPSATVVMFTGNDFDPQYDPFASTGSDGDGAVGGASVIPGQAWLRRNSAMYNYLRKGWNRLLVAVGVREIPPWTGYQRLEGTDDESRAHYAEYERQLLELKQASGVPMVLTAFPLGQVPESYERMRGIAERVGARWIDFSNLWEDEAAYRRNGALAWSGHPNADSHRIFGERITRVVEELLARE